MIERTASIKITRPVEVVFKYIADDFANTYPEYSSDVEKIEQLTEGPVGVSTVFKMVQKPELHAVTVYPKAKRGTQSQVDPRIANSLRDYNSYFVVTEYEQNKKFEISASIRPLPLLKFKIKSVYIFTPIEDQTNLSNHIFVEVVGLLGKLYLKIFSKFIQEDDYNLNNIKEAIEAKSDTYR